MRLIVLVLLLATPAAHAAALKPEDFPAVPDWVIRGIAAVETKSYFRDDGKLVYVDHSGDTGETDDGLGPFQTTQGAFNMVRRAGERWTALRVDYRFAEAIARRYIGYLYVAKAGRDWTRALGWYRKGANWSSPAGRDYAARATAIGQELAPGSVEVSWSSR